MNRRKFISLGGMLSATALTGVSAATDSTEKSDELPRFEDGQLLSSASLNAMIDKINELQRRSRSI